MYKDRRAKLEFKFRTGQITPHEMDEFTNKIPTRPSPWASWSALLIAFFVAATLLALTGCSPDATYEKNRSSATPGGILRAVSDEETGCQYLVFVGPTGGITPRLNRDGKQVCK